MELGGADTAAAVAAEPAISPRLAEETVRLYAADWSAFRGWCGARALVALPAEAASVETYLRTCAEHLGKSTLRRRLAAILDQHRRHGLPLPVDAPVRAALRQAAGVSVRRTPPPLSARLLRMAARCPPDLAGSRDRALLLLAASGLGRSSLVGLDAEHVRFGNLGVELVVHDAHGGGVRTISIPRCATARLCPARALEQWLQASDTRYGPVFRKIDRWGNLEHRRFGTDAIRRILERRSLRRAPRQPALAPA